MLYDPHSTNSSEFVYIIFFVFSLRT